MQSLPVIRHAAASYQEASAYWATPLTEWKPKSRKNEVADRLGNLGMGRAINHRCLQEEAVLLWFFSSLGMMWLAFWALSVGGFHRQAVPEIYSNPWNQPDKLSASRVIGGVHAPRVSLHSPLLPNFIPGELRGYQMSSVEVSQPYPYLSSSSFYHHVKYILPYNQ